MKTHMTKEMAFESLQYIADTAAKMSGVSVGEVRRFDKAIVFLDNYIQDALEPIVQDEKKPVQFNGKKSAKPIQQSGAI